MFLKIPSVSPHKNLILVLNNFLSSLRSVSVSNEVLKSLVNEFKNFSLISFCVIADTILYNELTFLLSRELIIDWTCSCISFKQLSTTAWYISSVFEPLLCLKHEQSLFWYISFNNLSSVLPLILIFVTTSLNLLTRLINTANFLSKVIISCSFDI